MRIWPIDAHKLDKYFPKSGNFFSIFKKGKGDPPPPPVSCAPEYLLEQFLLEKTDVQILIFQAQKVRLQASFWQVPTHADTIEF